MSIDWNHLISAMALLLIFEGLLPFLSPQRLRETYALLQKLPDKTLRTVGFFSLLGGVLLLLLNH